MFLSKVPIVDTFWSICLAHNNLLNWANSEEIALRTIWLNMPLTSSCSVLDSWLKLANQNYNSGALELGLREIWHIPRRLGQSWLLLWGSEIWWAEKEKRDWDVQRENVIWDTRQSLDDFPGPDSSIFLLPSCLLALGFRKISAACPSNAMPWVKPVWWGYLRQFNISWEQICH